MTNAPGELLESKAKAWVPLFLAYAAAKPHSDSTPPEQPTAGPEAEGGTLDSGRGDDGLYAQIGSRCPPAKLMAAKKHYISPIYGELCCWPLCFLLVNSEVGSLRGLASTKKKLF